MGFFKWAGAKQSAPKSSTRVIVHRALSSWSWVQVIFVMQEEFEGRHLVRLNCVSNQSLDDDDWHTVEFSSFAQATSEMEKLREKIKRVGKTFPAADVSDVLDYQESWSSEWGFKTLAGIGSDNGLIRFARGETSEDIDDIDWLSLGNSLANILEDRTFSPVSREEVNAFWTFMASSSLHPGMFGNFKFVLKQLTDRFDQFAEELDEETLSVMAGALGSGYGRIEAYLSKGNLSPIGYLTREDHGFRGLRHLPEFGARTYISTATAQYLARKGLRLLKKIEANHSGLVATRFKVNLINTADMADERSARFPEYQIIVNHIIYGDSGLATRHPSARKSALSPVDELAEYEVSESFIAGLTAEELGIWSAWVANVEAKNPLITAFALQLSELLGVEFPWTDEIVKALSKSTLVSASRALLKELEKDSSKFFLLEQEAQLRMLRTLSDSAVTEIIDSMPYNSWGLINQWVWYCSSNELTEREVWVSRQLLTRKPGQVVYWQINNLLVNLARYSHFEPFEEWSQIVSISSTASFWVSAENYVNFLGGGEEPGIFTVLEKDHPELIAVYANDLVKLLEWRGQEETDELLNMLLDSRLPQLNSIGSLLIRKRMFGEERTRAFLATRRDFNLWLVNLQDSVSENDRESISTQLSDLATDVNRVIWRKHGNEIEQILKEWKGFASYFWEAFSELPTFLVETFQSYSWFAPAVQAQITPGGVARMSQAQSELFVALIKRDVSILASDSMLRAVLIAPAAKINELGAKHVKDSGRIADFWLIMLESNLPVTSHAAYEYLRNQLGQPNVSEKLLMALDSNNKAARDHAKRLLSEIPKTVTLVAVVEKLVENRNPDTWSIVNRNLKLIKEKGSIQAFTRRVFLSRRQARSEKENIKRHIESLLGQVSDLVEKDILLRMTFSSVSKDREWALRQIASGAMDLENVTVETSWRGPADV